MSFKTSVRRSRGRRRGLVLKAGEPQALDSGPDYGLNSPLPPPPPPPPPSKNKNYGGLPFQGFARAHGGVA